MTSVSKGNKLAVDKRMEAQKMSGNNEFLGKSENVQEFKAATAADDDDGIEQMINELLDYGSIELCSNSSISQQ